MVRREDKRGEGKEAAVEVEKSEDKREGKEAAVEVEKSEDKRWEEKRLLWD